MRCCRRFYKDHVTNEDIVRKIQAAIGKYDELLTLVKRKRKCLTMSQGPLAQQRRFYRAQGKEKRRKSRQKKRWEDNIREWTGMDFASSTRATEAATRWKGIVVKSSVVPERPRKVIGKTRLDLYEERANNSGSE